METVKDMGNPFLDQSEELLTLDMAIVLDKSVVETVYSIEALGKEQFKTTSSWSLWIVLALFMSQSKRTISLSLKILNLSQKQSNHRLLKA